MSENKVHSKTDTDIEKDIDEMLKNAREARSTSPPPKAITTKPHKKKVNKAKFTEVREFVQTSFAEMPHEEKQTKKDFVVQIPKVEEEFIPFEEDDEESENVTFDDYLQGLDLPTDPEFTPDSAAPDKAKRIRAILSEPDEEGRPPNFKGIKKSEKKGFKIRKRAEDINPLDREDATVARKVIAKSAKSMRGRKRIADILLLVTFYMLIGQYIPAFIGHRADLPMVVSSITLALLLVVCREVPLKALQELASLRPSKMTLGTIAAILAVIQAATLGLYGDSIYTYYTSLVIYMLFREEFYIRRKLRSESKLSYSDRQLYEPKKLPKDGFLSDIDGNKVEAMRIDKVTDLQSYYTGSFSRTPSDEIGQRFFVAATLIAAISHYINITAGLATPTITVLLLSCLSALPIAAISGFFVPYAAISKKLLKHGTVIVGSDGLDELSLTDEALLTDGQIFGKNVPLLKDFKLYNDITFEEAIICATSLTEALGMPIRHSFLNMMDNRYDRLVKVTEIKYQDEAGIYSYMNGNVVAMGTADFMRQNMIRLPRDGAGDKIKERGGEPLYISIGGRLGAVFGVVYKPSTRAKRVFKMLTNAGVGILLATNDPLLTEEATCDMLGIKSGTLRIVPSRNRDELEGEITEKQNVSALYSRPDGIGFAHSIGAAVRVKNAIFANLAVGIMYTASSAILLFFAIFAGMLTSVSSFFIVMFGLLWCLPMIAVSYYTKKSVG